MGNHKNKYLHKVQKQLIARQENQLYYQNGSNPKTPRSDRERLEHGKLK